MPADARDGQEPSAADVDVDKGEGKGSGRDPSGAMKLAPASASRARGKRSGVSVCRVISRSPARTNAPGLALSLIHI